MRTQRDGNPHGYTCPDLGEYPSAGHGESARTKRDEGGSLFELGTVVASPGALLALVRANQDAAELMARHAHGDWGALAGEQAAANDRAVKQGLRLLSVYTLSGGTVLRVVTEADRSATCILLAEED